VSIAGSTGSIGLQALDVIRSAPDEFQVVALGANRSVDVLARQAQEFMPEVVALVDEKSARELAQLVPSAVEVISGSDALAHLGAMGDVVLNAVVGFAGLLVTVNALSSGRRLALANKESLIAGAPVVQVARATPGAELVPVDSEHCAIHQCLGTYRHARKDGVRGGDGRPFPVEEVRRLIVTASGGPFRDRTRSELATVSVEEALTHPTWKMGPKITIDSSTLMNKGLEVIEAHELFGVGYDRIEVVVHPQSIVHSMVEFCDGATIAQLSNPDMRLPIGYALSYPNRLATAFGAIDWSQLRRLDFEKPDTATFRCLQLAYEAGRAGGSVPAWLNAANEIAVDAFLHARISWLQIADVVDETLTRRVDTELIEATDVLEADAAARRVALSAVEHHERAG
jgi:1-deoxy-D-xylulose-5-phosphate reductoisomerase